MPEEEVDAPVRAPRRRLRAPRTFTSLRHRNFRLLWITTLCNAGSSWIQQVTLGWLAYDLTGSALTAALVYGLRSLPQLLVGPIGGVLGDRFERKRGLQFNSCYMSILAMGFAALLAFGHVHTWHILLFTLLQGLGQSLVGPVRQAMVVNTVPREDLMNAIALNSFAQNSMRVIGPSIAGALIALSGPAVNFGIQGVAYVLVFILVLPIQTPYSTMTRRRRHEASIREAFGEGLKYVRGQPTIMGLILLALVPVMFTTPINLGLLPVFARDVLHVDSSGLGLLYSVQGLGAVAGTLTLASLGNYRNKGRLLTVCACCLTVTITLYSQITFFLMALPMLAFATCCFMTYQTLNQTIIQTTTPDEYLGRVMGLRMMDQGLAPFANLIFGTIAEFYGVRTAIFIAGCCAMGFLALILWRFPSVRNFRSGEEIDEVSTVITSTGQPAVDALVPAVPVPHDAVPR